MATILDDQGVTIYIGALTTTGGRIHDLEDWDEKGWRVVERWGDGTEEKWLTRGATGPWDYDTLICDEVRIVIARHDANTSAMATRLADAQGQL